MRGVLDSFLQRAALFTAIYLLVGNVFQQSYLRSLGLRVGLIDPSHLLPSFTDIYVLAYVTLVWGVASRYPDRWYNHVAEMLNLSTWRNPGDFISRGFGVLMVWLLFLLTNYWEIWMAGLPQGIAPTPICFPSRIASPPRVNSHRVCCRWIGDAC